MADPQSIEQKYSELLEGLPSLATLLADFEDVPEFLTLASSVSLGDFGKAVATIEQLLDQSVGDGLRYSAAKLLWIRCQLESEQMPPSALSSPLEELVTKAVEVTRLQPLALDTAIRLTFRLIERGQLKLATLVSEQTRRLVNVMGGCPLANQIRGGFVRCFQELLKRELERAELKRESSEYLNSLRQQLLSIEKERYEVQARKEKLLPGEPPVRQLSAKVIVAEAVRSDSSSTPDTATGETAATLHLSELQAPREGALKSGVSLRQIGWSLSVICLLALAGTYYVLGDKLWAPPVERLVMQTEVVSRPEVVVPLVGLSGVEKGSAGPSLAEVSDKLSRVELSTGGSSAKVSPSPRSSEGDNSSATPAALNGSQVIEQGSSEGEEVGRFGATASGSAIPPAKLPELDPLGLEVAPVELGKLGKRQAVDDRELKTGEDGRVYGPGPRSGEVRVDPKSGKPVKAYEVEQFERAVEYRTLTQTRVLSRPSMTAAPIDTLQRNSVVNVYSRMGHWLELRNGKGRPGYIYSQDATPITGSQGH